MNKLHQSIFLQFLNREIIAIRELNFTEAEYIRWTKICSLMSNGPLVASFGQLHEISNKMPSLRRLVERLCGIDELSLIGGEADFNHFIDRRKELYSLNKKFYSNYYQRKQYLSGNYSHASEFDTTKYIKDQIAQLARGHGASNVISRETIDLIKENKSFLLSDFFDPKIAATFSIYSKLNWNSDPQITAKHLGHASTGLFFQNYTMNHGLASPTGIFNDETLEDYDHFPHFDLNINALFLDCLGLRNMFFDPQYELLLISFLQDDEYIHFATQKNSIFEIMTKYVGNQSVNERSPIPYKKFLREFDFGINEDFDTVSPVQIAELIYSKIESHVSKGTEMAQHISSNIIEGVERRNVVVFTATDTEDDAFRAVVLAEGFKPIKTGEYEGVAYQQYSFGGKINLFHVRTSAGSSTSHGSIVHASSFLKLPNIDNVYSIGICFGVNEDKQAFGDVVVSEVVFNYEPKSVRGAHSEFRGDDIPSCSTSLGFARIVRSEFPDFNVHTGVVISGEKLVDERIFRDGLLKSRSRIVGGDMEAAGLALICNRQKISFSVVKGICDFGTGKTDDHQLTAAENAVKLALRIIKQG